MLKLYQDPTESVGVATECTPAVYSSDCSMLFRSFSSSVAPADPTAHVHPAQWQSLWISHQQRTWHFLCLLLHGKHNGVFVLFSECGGERWTLRRSGCLLCKRADCGEGRRVSQYQCFPSNWIWVSSHTAGPVARGALCKPTVDSCSLCWGRAVGLCLLKIPTKMWEDNNRWTKDVMPLPLTALGES